MMKTLLAVLGVTTTAAAAVSPVSQYIWVGTYLTNSVSGYVMGDGCDYSAMRYEDILFLTEADLDRYELYYGFTSLQSYLNSKGNESVTPKIGRDLPLNCTKYYVDENILPSDDIRYCTGTVSHVDHATNVSVIVTNIVTVRRTLTNGTEDVYTSSYSFLSNMTWTIVTNSYEKPHVQDDSWIASFAYSSNPFTVYDTKIAGCRFMYYNDLYSVPYSKLVITNTYAAIRACRRTLPIPTTLVCYPLDLNSNKVVNRHYAIDGSSTGIPALKNTYTYSHTPQYAVNIYSNESYSYGQKPVYDSDSGSWKTTSYIDETLSKSVDTYDPEVTTLKFVTRIPKQLETDSGRQVVRKLYAYMSARFTYLRTTSIGYSTNTNSAQYANESKTTNETFIAVIPFGEGERIQDDSDMVSFSATKSDLADKIRSAITRFGWTVLTPSVDPEHMLARNNGEPVYYTHAASGIRSWEAKSQRNTTESIGLDNFKMMYILDVRPQTTLSSWIND